MLALSGFFVFCQTAPAMFPPFLGLLTDSCFLLKRMKCWQMNQQIWAEQRCRMSDQMRNTPTAEIRSAPHRTKDQMRSMLPAWDGCVCKTKDQMRMLHLLKTEVHKEPKVKWRTLQPTIEDKCACKKTHNLKPLGLHVLYYYFPCQQTLPNEVNVPQQQTVQAHQLKHMSVTLASSGWS